MEKDLAASPAVRAKRKVTLRDVAAAAGVHVSTASRALDTAGSSRIGTATTERVRNVAAELGYSRDLLASSLKRGVTQTVAVIVADLDNPLNARVIRGIARVLEAGDFVPLMAETGESRERFEKLLDHFGRRRVDALISLAIRLDGAEMLARKVGDDMPIILGGRTLPDTDYNTVRHDDVAGGTLAAEHLASLGHRRVAQLGGPADIDAFLRRTAAFSAAAAKEGMEEVEPPAPGAVTPTFVEGRRLMSALLDSPRRPTGVFAPSDVMAVGALDAISGRGLRCPDDISVVGYNDLPLSRFVAPPLTTIELQAEELGAEAARMAIESIADPARRGRLVTLPARLIVRRSTGPAAD
ncbi:MAG TPA: substrate-binding domain-containing protein [Solirubrobacterales bacterium]|nr:substrate-binding domain-containing protein [Solirubrobacterales bacterium]